MEFDAFDAGVELGGLRSQSEIRLLICYLLRSVGEPLSKETIDEVMQSYGLANYFDVSQALLELVQLGSIKAEEADKTTAYTIAPNGSRAAEMLESALPVTVREKAVNAALQLIAKQRRERENRVRIDKADGHCTVSCAVLDSNAELMEIKLCVADELQAQTVKENFLRNPAGVYQSMIALLTGGFDSE